MAIPASPAAKSSLILTEDTEHTEAELRKFFAFWNLAAQDRNSFKNILGLPLFFFSVVSVVSVVREISPEDSSQTDFVLSVSLW